MSFPISPTDGQITIVNGIQYTYSTAKNSWKRTPQPVGNLTVTGNLVANVLYTDYGIRWAGNGAVYGGGVGDLSTYTGNISAGNIFVSTETINVPPGANLEFDPDMMYSVGPSFVLSNNNTTVTALSTMPGEPSLLGTLAIQDNEKKVFTTYINSGPAREDYLGIGVARANINLSNYPGQVWFTSVAVYDDGVVYGDNSYSNSLPFFGAGDTVDIAVDRVNDLLWVRVNGGNWNDDPANNPATATGYGVSLAAFNDADPLYPIYGPYYYSGSSDEISILQVSPYTLPSGFTMLEQLANVYSTYSNVLIGNGVVNAGNIITTNGVYWSNGAAYGGGAGDLTNISSNVIPSANVTYDLGSSTNRWRDLWLSGNTIHLGNTTITTTGDTISLPVNLSTYTGNIGTAGNITNYWASTYGDSTYSTEEYGSSITFDATGYMYVIGGQWDTYTPLILKYDTDGNIVWQKAFEGLPPEAYGEDIIVTPTNNIVALFSSNIIYDSSVLIQLNSDGEVLWQRKIDNISTERTKYSSIKSDSTGNIIVGGYDLDYPPATDVQHRPVLFKFDSNGTLIWQFRIDNFPVGYFYGIYYSLGLTIIDIAVDSLDNIYALGTYWDPDGIVHAGLYYYNTMVLFKFDSSGNLMWQRSYDGTQFPGFYWGFVGKSLTVDSQDNVYTLLSVVDGDVGNYTGIIKFDSLGNTLWQRKIEISNAGSYIVSIKTDALDNVYVNGRKYDVSNLTEMYILKFDSAGNLIWQRNLGTAADDYQVYNQGHKNFDIFQDSFVITGYTYTFYDSSYVDIVVAKLPIDGTLTGNAIGQWNYYETNYIVSTASYTANTSRDFTTNTISHSISIPEVTISTIPNFVNNLVSFGNVIHSPEYSVGNILVDTLTSKHIISTNNISTKNVIVENSITWSNGTQIGHADSAITSIPSINWALTRYQINDNSAEQFSSSVAYDKTGNIYVIGGSWKNIVTVSNALILKFDRYGNQLWQKTLSINGITTYGESIVVDHDNNVVIVLNSGANPFTPQTFRVCIIKLDPNGNEIWQIQLDRDEIPETVRDISVDQNNNYYICGTSNYIVGLNPNIGFVVKINASGEVQWQKDISAANLGAAEINLNSISVDLTGNLSVTGYLSYYGTVPLIKLDASGNVLFERYLRYYDDFSPDVGHGIKTDSENNIYIVGEARYPMDYSQPGFIAKYDADGNLLWDRQITTDNMNYFRLYALDIDANDDIYISGTAYTNQPTSYDLTVFKYDKDGNQKSQKTIGTIEDEYSWYSWGRKAISFYNNSIAVTGYTSGGKLALIQLDFDEITANISSGEWFCNIAYYGNTIGAGSNLALTDIDYIVGNLVTYTGNATINDVSLVAGTPAYFTGGNTSLIVDNVYTTKLNANIIVDNRGSVRSAPWSGSADKTINYTLTADDIGGFVSVGSGGNVTIPNNVFVPGNIVTVYNNTAANISITCSSLVTYVAGIDTVKTSIDVYTRGVATILFTGANSCVVSGNVN